MISLVIHKMGITGIFENIQVSSLYPCPKREKEKDGTLGKKGIFVGYSETSKDYMIYVLGQKNIEVSKDVTFHKQVAFKRSKELTLDTEMEEPEASQIQVPDSSPFGSNTQRENSIEPFEQIEPKEQIERPLEAH